MALLFSPLKIKSLTLKNRIVVSPMCQYSASEGFANNWHLVHLGSRAVGGAGLIIMEATAVSPEGRISVGDLGIWDDAHIPKLTEITDFITQNGALAGIQLAHAGRKASFDIPWKNPNQLQINEGGWDTVAPSALRFNEGDKLPLALDEQGIEKIKKDFKLATQRAIAAGFKVIEIHAAHGYLIHQFLSPLSNERTDQYGGSFENRIRLLLELVELVKAEIPEDLVLFVRISASDWVDGGWNLEESIQLAKRLKELGVDLIDVSSGGLSLEQKITVKPNYQVPFASEIRKNAQIPTAAVGLITDSMQAEEILKTEEADLIFLAREMLRNPYFPLQAAQELGVDILWPYQYERAKPRKK